MIKYLKIARESLGKGRGIFREWKSPYRGFWLDAVFVILFFSMFVVTTIRFYKADEKIPLLLNFFLHCYAGLVFVTIFFTPVLLLVRRIMLAKINIKHSSSMYVSMCIFLGVFCWIAYIFVYFIFWVVHIIRIRINRCIINIHFFIYIFYNSRHHFIPC